MSKGRPPRFLKPPHDDDLKGWEDYTREVKKTKAPDLYTPPLEYAKPDVKPYGQQAGFWDAMATPYQSFEPTGLDPKIVKSLRRGKYKIEDRLDLHGLTLDGAHQAFTRFIDLAFYRGLRCVLVITGRAFLSQNENRTIKGSVHGWMEPLKRSGKILTVTQAQPQDGGEGALYILLRRKR